MQLAIWEHSRQTLPSLQGVGTGEFYNWGDNNTLPQLVILNISNSPTATACTNKIEDYIYSGGITTSAFGIYVNEKQTLNSLFKSIAKQVSYFEAFALLVKRTPFGIKSIELIPIENLRKRRYGSEFVYSSRFSQGLNSHNKNRVSTYINLPEYCERTPLELIALRNQQIKDYGAWFGEVYFSFIDKPGSYLYPSPDWLAGLADVQSDISIMKYRLETLENGMMPASILAIRGEVSDAQPIDPVTNEFTGKSEYQKLEENLREFQGSGNRAKTMVLTGLEEKPEFMTIDHKAQIDGLKLLSEIQPAQVARAFGVPDILIGGIRPGALGNREELEVSMNSFWNSLSSLRSLVFEAFREFYPSYSFEVQMFDPYGIKQKQDG